jgi:environmental stress-induced protein Ves
MSVQILRAADLVATPWKNGGGVTREIIAWPPASDLSNFACRVSMARVSDGGPFSTFPGVDRILTVLEGKMTLELPDRDVTLDGASEPFAFPGDIAVSARRPASPVTDFNVMTRRGEFSARVERVRFQGERTLADLDWALIFCRSPGISLRSGDQTWTMGLNDSIVLVGETGIVATTSGGSDSDVLIARFEGSE